MHKSYCPNAKWNIKMLIVAPAGASTDFTANQMLLNRLPVYADDPESLFNQLLQYMKAEAGSDS